MYTRRISNSNHGELLLPTKINPLENLTREILSARKFFAFKVLKIGSHRCLESSLMENAIHCERHTFNTEITNERLTHQHGRSL